MRIIHKPRTRDRGQYLSLTESVEFLKSHVTSHQIRQLRALSFIFRHSCVTISKYLEYFDGFPYIKILGDGEKKTIT